MPFGGLLTVGLISTGGSLLGGLFGSRSASKAAAQQAAATDKASGTIQDFYNKNMQTLSPYQDAGAQGLSQLRQFLAPGDRGTAQYGNFTPPDPNQVANTPEYQFAAQQGMKGVLANRAAHGDALGGGAYRALDQFNQGLASQQYQNAFQNALGTYNTNFNTFNTNGNNLYNRLMGLTGIGQQATNIGVGATSDLGANLANLYTQKGNAQAAGTVGSANAWNGALGSIGSNLTSLYGQAYGRQQQSAPGY